MARVILSGLLAVVVLLLFGLTGSDSALCGAGCQEEVLEAQVPRETSPMVADEELQELVAGNTAFALDLYRQLRGQEENLFFSPYSISLALAMAYGGARGETEEQMAEALHFTLPRERLHPAFNLLDLEITSRTEQEGVELRVANALWGQLDHRFLQEYIDLLSENYGAEIHLVNFQSTPEPCRERINGWVRERTEGKIEGLLPPDSVTSDTRLVLTNAIYFKAKWHWQFDPQLTHDGPFKLLDGGEVTVPMMELEEAGLGYTRGEGYQALYLPYVGGGLGMVILLPDLERFLDFEQELDREKLDGILDELEGHNIHLIMPKFSFVAGFSLKDKLSSLGMPLAFSERADFSGMDGERDLKIDDAYHEAFVKVNEQGTEAAAATGTEMGMITAIDIIEVRVDHPFIFLIHDRETGTILFMGRVLNPAM